MTPEQRIDANIDAFLKAAGYDISWYSCAEAEKMREAMKVIMLDSYTRGTQDNFDAMVASGRWKK